MWNNFVEKLTTVQAGRNTNIVLMFNPRLDLLPLPITRFDDPFFPFGKQVIDATQDMICAYMFDLASYMALGAAGVIALERTIGYIAHQTPTILHAPFTGTAYSRAMDRTAFDVDALTITDAADLNFYIKNPPHAAFVTQSNEVDTEAHPKQGGIFWQDADAMTLIVNNQIRLLQVTTNEVLFAGKLDNFTDDIRSAIEAMR